MDEKNKTILVVEDEKGLANAVKDALTVNNFNVIMASTVEDAITELTKAGKIDAIWLDHYLIGSASGLDFVVELKSHPVWSEIPVFIVSNTASQQNVHSYIRLGVTNYYTKADYDISQIISDLKYTIENTNDFNKE